MGKLGSAEIVRGVNHFNNFINSDVKTLVRFSSVITEDKIKT